MLPLSRRTTLKLGSGALAAAALPGCAPDPTDYPVRPITGQLIDAHCHLFNGTDLPITTFLTRLALPGHDDQTCDLPKSAFHSLTVEDPTLFEELVRLLVSWLLRSTPTAQEELDLLTRDHTTTADSEAARVRGKTLRNLTAFLEDDPAAIQGARLSQADSLRDALRQEARDVDQGKRLQPQTAPITARQDAEAILKSERTFGALIRWVWLFFRSRQSLAQELVTASRSWQREPLMLVPLMVDYAHWLGETTQRGSSFFDQIAVYGALAARSEVPIHGMVPYDPLRSVFWTRGKHDRFKTDEFDPLDLAEAALTRHGFLGLKVYPPMGFRASGNAGSGQDYPAPALAALGLSAAELGGELDRAMIRAFDFCLRHDAPMLAHANNSVAAGPGYGRRAEPRFWTQALKLRPGLRLCLAHSGGFCWEASDPAGKGASWEWSIGRYVRDNPETHLYMDISYFSEALKTSGRLDHVVRQLRRWIAACDPEARHLIFGTDWIMVEREPSFKDYGPKIISFLKDRIRLTDEQVERVMWGNAMRFLGLDSGKTRDRLLGFYGTRRPAWTTLAPA